MPSFVDALGIHPQAIALRARRAEILAGNLANAETPGYRARDIDFKEVLGRHDSATILHATHAGHTTQARNGRGEYTLKYRQPLQASLDQNSVDAQTERAAFLDNALRYQASVTFLNGRISGLISALRGE